MDPQSPRDSSGGPGLKQEMKSKRWRQETASLRSGEPRKSLPWAECKSCVEPWKGYSLSQQSRAERKGLACWDWWTEWRILMHLGSCKSVVKYHGPPTMELLTDSLTNSSKISSLRVQGPVGLGIDINRCNQQFWPLKSLDWSENSKK